MIGWLSGKVLSKDASAGNVLLDVGGVGYLLIVSFQTLLSVPDIGGDCELWVHTHVREEALSLYGFATEREKLVFRLLTSVPKVGPKNAVAVLGGFGLDEVIAGIAHAEAPKLQRIPGIGKKTAEQICLSLQDRMQVLASEDPGDPDDPTPVDDLDGNEIEDEAAAALVQWGWKPKPVGAAIDQVVEEAGDEELVLEELLRRVTRILTAR